MFGPPMMPMTKKDKSKPKGFKGRIKSIGSQIKGFFSRYAYIFKLVWEASPLTLFVMSFTAILTGLLPVIGAFITKRLIESITLAFNFSSGLLTNTTSEEILKTIIFWIVFQFFFMLCQSLTNTIYSAITSLSGEKVSNHIKCKIISKAKTIDVAQFDLPEFYQKLENASREASFRPIQILSATFSMISSLISMISFVIVLFALSPLAPLFIIILALPAAIIKFVYGRKNFLYARGRSKERRHMEYFSQLMTHKDLVKEVRIFNLSDTFIGKFKTTFAKYYKGLKKLVVQENIWHVIITVTTGVVNALLFFFVAYQVLNGNGQFTIGDYTLYSGALTSILGAVSSVVSSTATIYQGTLFIDNMIEYNKVESKILPIQDPPLDVNRHIAHEIEFKNVCFSYPGSSKLVINDVSFTLKPGTTTVLVGLNGAGKTTLIKLMTRLYDPTSGVILLDGEDIRKYDLAQLYQIYGTIFQDFGRYAVSASENIYYGDVNAPIDEDRVKYAAENSGASAFIESLVRQYDTPLMKYFEEDGTELSLGQWQKLSVARAFYSDSDIMILDEPTASLDAMAEQQIFQQFESLTEGKTSVFVSHRLSSATTADNIIVIEHGKVVEEGNHKQLMELNGKYCELFTTQAKRYIDTE